MKRYKVWTIFCCLLLASAFVVGCGSDEDDEQDGDAQAEAFDASTMLNDFANSIVVPTYTDLDDKAGALLSAVKALEGDTLASESRKSTTSVGGDSNTLGTERSISVRSR